MQSLWARRFVAVCAVLSLMLGLAACGGVSDTTVPPPPGGTEVKQGDDPNVDLLISTFSPAIEGAVGQQNAKVDKTAYYTSSSSVADIVSFYETEMKNRGWEPLASNSQAAGQGILGYNSGNNGVLIYVGDGSLLGSSGTFVMTTNISSN